MLAGHGTLILSDIPILKKILIRHLAVISHKRKEVKTGERKASSTFGIRDLGLTLYDRQTEKTDLKDRGQRNLGWLA